MTADRRTADRRTIVQGAAWATPAIVVGSAASALAASSTPVTCETIRTTLDTHTGMLAVQAPAGSVFPARSWVSIGGQEYVITGLRRYSTTLPRHAGSIQVYISGACCERWYWIPIPCADGARCPAGTARRFV